MYKRVTLVTRAICCGWSLSFIPNTTIKRHYFSLLFHFMYANFLACAQYAKIWMPTNFPHRQAQNTHYHGLHVYSIICNSVVPKREIHCKPCHIKQIKQTISHFYIDSEWGVWSVLWIKQTADIILISLKAITSSKSWHLRDEIHHLISIKLKREMTKQIT